MSEWVDELDNEEDLMCLSEEEYYGRIPYFVDDCEIRIMFKMGYNIKVDKLNEDRYKVSFDGNVLYFICPFYARSEVRGRWEGLKKYFEG